MSRLQALAKAAARPGSIAGPRLRAHGSLREAVQRQSHLPAHERGALPILAEVKAASPSAGPLLAREPADYLGHLARGGAAGISAVTAGGPFQGSLALLRQAHALGRPTLMKDFVTTEEQLDGALEGGASAVLLIERLVGPRRREQLVSAAHDRGLEVLLEAHGPAEAAAVATSAADLLGVNSRDLESLHVDVPHALAAVRHAKHAQAANDAGRASRPVLLLSGIATPAAADAARRAGADGILVGEALLKAPHPATLLRALRRPLAKACGLGERSDVAAATDAGADLAGVVVGTDSARDVPLADAADLLQQARAGGALAVAVTRDRDGPTLLRLAQATRPDALQVHGPLRAQDVAALRARGFLVLQGVVAGQAPTVGVDGTITDSTPGGGSGTRHAGRVPATAGLHLVAGGLDAGTAREAVRRSGAVGADASSRLERGGRKDADEVRRFVHAVQATIPDLAEVPPAA